MRRAQAYGDGGEGRNDSDPQLDGEAQVALQQGATGLHKGQRSRVKVNPHSKKKEKDAVANIVRQEEGERIDQTASRLTG